MTGEEFVKACYETKESSLAEYFDIRSESLVGMKIQELHRSYVGI